MTILFVVDANRKLGLGHIMRCMSLADEMKRRGHSALFAIRRYDGISAQLLKRKNIEHIVTDEGLTEKQEAEKIISLAGERNASAVIFDRYDLTNEFISDIRRCGAPIFLVDDRNYLINPDVDAIINGNEFAGGLDYKISDKTKLFLGTEFFMMDKKFLASENDTAEKRTFIAGVCISGIDYSSIKQLVEFLKPFANGRIALIFTPAQKEQMNTIKRECGNSENFTTYYDLEPGDFADIMKQCRLFFCGGGTMMYQAVASGCIVFAVPVNEYQQRNAGSLKKRNIVRVLKKDTNVSSETQKEIEQLINSHEERTKILKRTTKFMDGKGTQRVADIICAYQND